MQENGTPRAARRGLALLACAAFALLLAACRPPAHGPVYLARGVPFALREPRSGPTFFASQEVRFQFPDGREETLLTTVENTSEHLSLVASAPMGQTLFIVRLQGGEALVEKRVPLPSLFDPRLVLALVQLANWPLEEARRGLDESLSLQETGQVRELRRRDKTLLILQREGPAPPYAKVTLELPPQSLKATITTLDE
ncbi:MAG: DUF3261 domain-containing protein [Firmicutes bacterium]|nr:DUF3261 domain-containing protein [Bacillota bacterium]